MGLWHYRGAVRRLVHAFKYHGRVDVLAPLGRRMAASPRLAAPALGRAGPLLVVPVPARRRSRRLRRYDQAVLLARALAASLGLPMAQALTRRRDDGEAQAGQPATRRRRRMGAAFRSRPVAEGRHVLLVDDVISTGATADAASRALRCAGARSVTALTLAT